MKVSCNGCRVLRKGCSKSCSIRPCLQWIKCPESQAHATIFLAKFYGRTGLLNLIDSGSDHLRPEIFKSLLYEACGRIVNPVYGLVGLLWSGSWPMVEAAVEAVLKGEQIVPIPSDAAAAAAPVLNPTYNIRHVSKTGPGSELHKVDKTRRTSFKRSAKGRRAAHTPQTEPEPANEPEPSHTSSNEGPTELICCTARHEVSADRAGAVSHVSQDEPESVVEYEDEGLDLTLGFGFEPASQGSRQAESNQSKRRESSSDGSTGSCCSLSLELQLSV